MSDAENVHRAVTDPTVSAAGAPLKNGTELGAYRLIELLGEGGMGFVFLAEHKRLGRKVALKLLRPEYGNNPKAVARFFGEARAVNQISHENIVEITDFIEDEGEEKYYIMELLKGTSLHDQLMQQTMPIDRVVGICIQICEALAAVHAAGIVHRDMKPDNVFLITRGGRQDVVKLLDFGVAKLGDLAAETNVSQTIAGSIIGTPEYMSPEQAAGKLVDYRTDIYALGVVMFEMVTGQKPFTGKSFGEMVIKHMTVAPPKPSKLKDASQAIPAKLEALILACLAKEPDKRPQSMAEIAEKLQAIAEDGALEIESFSGGVWSLAGAQRNKIIAGAVAAAGIMVLVTWIVASDDEAEQGASDPSAVAAIDEAAIPVEPAEPTSIEIAFESTPSGAEVFRKGSDEPLGMTPFSFETERAEATQDFEIKLAGHLPVEQSISLERDSRVSVSLAKVAKRTVRRRPPPASTKTKKRRGSGRRGVIDPFAED